MADWTQQYFFLATIFPEAPKFDLLFHQHTPSKKQIFFKLDLE
jgi:hypothetical protein